MSRGCNIFREMKADRYTLQLHRAYFTERCNLCKCFVDISVIFHLSRVCSGIFGHRTLRFVSHHALSLNGKYILRHVSNTDIQQMYSIKLSLVLTWSMFFVVTILIVPLSKPLAIIYVLSVMFVTFVCPYWLKWVQQYKKYVFFYCFFIFMQCSH